MTSSETLFDGHGWKVVMESAPLPDGRVKKVARVHRVDSVSVIAFVNDQEMLLLREFRPYYGTYIWMLPSGRIDKESDIEAGAQRELQEETGYRAKSLKLLWSVNHSESIVSTNHIYLARDLEHSPLPQDADELIEVHQLSVAEALKRIEASEKVHLPSAYALQRYLREQSL